MDGRAGILGIGVPSGPINLSSSQETGRTALPSGFKGVEGHRPQKGNTGVAIPDRASVPLFRGYPSRIERIPRFVFRSLAQPDAWTN